MWRTRLKLQQTGVRVLKCCLKNNSWLAYIDHELDRYVQTRHSHKIPVSVSLCCYDSSCLVSSLDCKHKPTGLAELTSYAPVRAQSLSVLRECTCIWCALYNKTVSCWKFSFYLALSFHSAPLGKHKTSLEVNRTAYIDAFPIVQLSRDMCFYNRK